MVLLTSRLDNRDGVGYISSRIGMKRKAYPIGDDTDILVTLLIWIHDLTVF